MRRKPFKHVPTPTAYAPMSLTGLRKYRRKSQSQIARTMGVSQPSVSGYESSTNPSIATLDSYLQAMGGTLVLIVAFPEADGTISRQIIKLPGDTREITVDLLTSPRWNKPQTNRPAHEGFVLRRAQRSLEPAE